MQRIAVLFDAENIDCATACRSIDLLAARGHVAILRAVGDFSLAALSNWIGCARDNGIELILQPGLGKGKNSADIRLTIEAMDIISQGRIDTMALVSHDRDFTPLALRLRHAGITALGMGRVSPSPAFRAACSSFELVGLPPAAVAKPTAPTPAGGVPLTKGEVTRLLQVIMAASRQGPIPPGELTRAIIAAEPALATRLSGKNRFLKTLVTHGLVERVGSGPALRVRAPMLRSAG